MTRTSKIAVLVTIATLALGVTALLLAQAAPAPPAPTPTMGRDSITVYMDISVLGRKHGAAENMTKMHAKKAAEGYTLLDVEPYTENGDLQGFYISYIRER